VPIPVFAEMGSVNPIFCFPQKLEKENDALAKAFVSSLTLGAGQFCTNPGLIFVPEKHAKNFEQAIATELHAIAAAPMLHEGIAKAYYDSIQALEARNELRWVKVADPRHLIHGSPALAEIKAADWLKDQLFHQEVFGAFALLVVYRDQEELMQIAEQLQGTAHDHRLGRVGRTCKPTSPSQFTRRKMRTNTLQRSSYGCGSRTCHAAWRAFPFYDGKPNHLCR
jgi:NADP-dependent aldehyde dehydrogenase